MLGSLRSDFWFRSLLSLIVLSASIGAPFRAHALGRSLLHSLPQPNATRCTVVRVQAVSGGGISQGFRAVVGFSKGGPDQADCGANSYVLSVDVPALGSSVANRHGDSPVARLNPPLRC